MVAPSVGAVVLIPFPFSDLSAAKLRPALVAAASDRDDWVCVQITSNPYADSRSVLLRNSDFTTGGLDRESHIRPAKLFTANQTLFRRVVGRINEDKIADVIEEIVKLFRP